MNTFSKTQTAVSLTLIPPAPVTDRISLDIRVAVHNRNTAARVFEVAVFLNVEIPAGRLHQERIEVAGQTAAGIKFRWPTTGQAGAHAIVAVITCGGETWRTSQPMTILASGHRSTDRIGGAWAGIYHWSEGEGRYWNCLLYTSDAADE